MESKLVRTYRDESNALVHVYEDTIVEERNEHVSEQEELDLANQVKAYLERTKSRTEQIESIKDEQEEDDGEFQHLLSLFSFEEEEDEPITQ